jgi:hypothetical protein
MYICRFKALHQSPLACPRLGVNGVQTGGGPAEAPVYSNVTTWLETLGTGLYGNGCRDSAYAMALGALQFGQH